MFLKFWRKVLFYWTNHQCKFIDRKSIVDWYCHW